MAFFCSQIVGNGYSKVLVYYNIRKGEPPGNSAAAVFRSILDLPYAPNLSPEEVRYLSEKLYDGYFGFESLTSRDWNDAVCGICGVCPTLGRIMTGYSIRRLRIYAVLITWGNYNRGVIYDEVKNTVVQ